MFTTSTSSHCVAFQGHVHAGSTEKGLGKGKSHTGRACGFGFDSYNVHVLLFSTCVWFSLSFIFAFFAVLCAAGV